MKELTSSKEFVIVAVMDFGKALVSFSTAPKEMKDARVLMECGSYEGPRLQRKIEFISQCWQLVYAYISSGPEDYRHALNSSTTLHPCSTEFSTEKGLEDMEPEKGEGVMQLNVKNKVLRKYRLDFFSGGIFAREALLSGRDVIYFANTEPEAIFLKEYGKALVHYSERVRQWFLRYKSAKVPTSSSQQPALASLSQQPGLASVSQQPARAVTHEDEIEEETDAAKFVFDAVLENEARTHLGNARRRVEFHPNIV
ncbi:hypothetical protein R1sor_007588 [Riccia sorocarpa]|uniref:Uncharacterized protein n=1 Tax=Riccia sorocarpa TaxID=122646 RepID=A0ABD3HTT2_9MARC